VCLGVCVCVCVCWGSRGGKGRVSKKRVLYFGGESGEQWLLTAPSPSACCNRSHKATALNTPPRSHKDPTCRIRKISLSTSSGLPSYPSAPFLAITRGPASPAWVSATMSADERYIHSRDEVSSSSVGPADLGTRHLGLVGVVGLGLGWSGAVAGGGGGG